MVAFSTAPAILEWFGWATIFYVFAAAGLLLFFAWQRYAADAPSKGGRGAQASEYRTRQPERFGAVPLMRQMLLSKPAWAIFGCHFLHSCGSYINLSWLPTYLEQRWGFPAGDTTLAVVPSWFVGCSSTLLSP